MQVIYILWRLENDMFFFDYLYFHLPDILAAKIVQIFFLCIDLYIFLYKNNFMK